MTPAATRRTTVLEAPPPRSQITPASAQRFLLNSSIATICYELRAG